MTQQPSTKRQSADPTMSIRNAILEGHLLPNERLVEQDLVQRFHANRGAIRVTLAVLEQQGLVVREPHRGARVRAVTEKEAVEIMETRAMVESLTARYAARHATKADVAELRAMTAEMEQLSAHGDVLEFSDLNVAFHARISDLARHSTAQRVVQGLNYQLVALQFRLIMEPGRIAQIDNEHRVLVEAIAANDPEKAETAMRQHLENSVTILRKAIASRRFVRRTLVPSYR